MNEPIFSEREGFAPRKDLQAQDYLPGWVREDITNKIKEFVYKNTPIPGVERIDIYTLFKPYIWKVLNRPPPNSPVGGPFASYIPKVLLECFWYQFYDILEEISSLIKQSLSPQEMDEFAAKINGVLAKEGIPWRLENGRVARRFHPQTAEQLEKVTILLHDEKFKGPDEQFAKAIEHLNRRPEPDEENCVKDAVGAIEAVANIIAGKNSQQLNNLLDREPFRSGIPATIRESINKVYAYRGAAPGAGHGQIGPPVVGIEEAEWVLATSAATILYFASKFCKVTF